MASGFDWWQSQVRSKSPLSDNRKDENSQNMSKHVKTYGKQEDKAKKEWQNDNDNRVV